MTYQPNFNDPRVKERTLKCISFVDRFVRTNKPQWISSKWLEDQENFGTHQLGKHLKELLLICVNEKYSVGTTTIKGKCKEYIQSERGMRYLKGKMGLMSKIDGYNLDDILHTNKTNNTTIPYCSADLHPTFQKHLNEFKTGEFQTQIKSNREFHDCQFLPASIKNLEFPKLGYQYNSDIVCAAPSILYQYAKRNGLKKDLMAIEYYINNRSQVRTRICNLLGMNTTPEERKTVKRILAGFFNGLYLTHRNDSQLIKDLKGKHILIDRLQDDLYITRLRKEITKMWLSIKKSRALIGITNKLTSSVKSEIYRKEEEEIRNCVKKYMRRNGINVFTEHDGWRTNKMYDVTELRSYIRSSTKYVIEIDWEVNEIH